MSGMSMYRVVWVGGGEGSWWLAAGGIRASKGTFSNYSIISHTIGSILQ